MKYNLTTICKTANYLARSMARPQAFATAWSMAKGSVSEKVTGVTKAKASPYNNIGRLQMHCQSVVLYETGGSQSVF